MPPGCLTFKLLPQEEKQSKYNQANALIQAPIVCGLTKQQDGLHSSLLSSGS